MDREISASEKKRRKKQIFIRILIPVSILIASIIAVSYFMESSLSQKGLNIGEVDEGPIEITVSASGQLLPLVEEIVVSPINSRILEIYKNPGDSVEEGEALLKLDLASVETEYKQKLDEREMMKSKLIQIQVKLDNSISELQMQQQIKDMQLKQLYTDLKSEIYLDSIGASTSDKIRRAELNYEEAKLELQQLKQRILNEKKNAEAELSVQRLELSIFEKSLQENARLLKDARILSPKKAILTFINNQLGAQVTQGSEIAIVSDLSRFKVESEISDGHREKLTSGARALIKIGDTKLNGTIVNIIPSITNGVVQFTVIPDNSDDPNLRSGLKVDVHVLYGRKQNVLRIPNKNQFKHGKGDYVVWVIKDGQAEKRRVSLGESSYEYIEVINGLSKGEKIILNNMDEYKNKETIKIK